MQSWGHRPSREALRRVRHLKAGPDAHSGSSTSTLWPCFSSVLWNLEAFQLWDVSCVAISRTNTYQDRPLLLFKKQSYPRAPDYLRAQGLKATRRVQHGDCSGRNWPEAHTHQPNWQISAVLQLWPSYELRCSFRLIRKLRVVWSTSIIGFGFFSQKDW